jgi:hypothetical protein
MESNFNPPLFFSGLNSGTYTVTAIDAMIAMCRRSSGSMSLMVHVDIGADHIILPGDTVILEAIVNVPYDSLSTITWSRIIKSSLSHLPHTAYCTDHHHSVFYFCFRFARMFRSGFSHRNNSKKC